MVQLPRCLFDKAPLESGEWERAPPADVANREEIALAKTRQPVLCFSRTGLFLSVKRRSKAYCGCQSG